ncbi:hypothetical protein PTTG_30599, partial [Puccinia triticina 1-1 BBBD Race 1]
QVLMGQANRLKEAIDKRGYLTSEEGSVGLQLNERVQQLAANVKAPKFQLTETQEALVNVVRSLQPALRPFQGSKYY